MIGVLLSMALASPFPSGAPEPICSSGVHKVVVSGVERRVRVRAPVEKSAQKPPVLFVWHGWGGSAKSTLKAIGKRVPRAVLVAPQGLPRKFPGLGKRALPGWQIKTGELDERDLELFDALLLRTSSCANGRVASTGFSNGAFFSNLLGCARGDKLVAIAPVSGGGPFEAKCQRPVPTLIMHGTRDRVVDLRRGRESYAHALHANRCEVAKPIARGCQKPACATETQLCLFDGGHRFPRAQRDQVAAWLSLQLSP